MLIGSLMDQVQVITDRLLQKGVDQRFFAGKVVHQPSFAESRFATNRRKGHCRQSTLQDQLHHRIKDPGGRLGSFRFGHSPIVPTGRSVRKRAPGQQTTVAIDNLQGRIGSDCGARHCSATGHSPLAFKATIGVKEKRAAGVTGGQQTHDDWFGKGPDFGLLSIVVVAIQKRSANMLLAMKCNASPPIAILFNPVDGASFSAD